MRVKQNYFMQCNSILGIHFQIFLILSLRLWSIVWVWKRNKVLLYGQMIDWQLVLIRKKLILCFYWIRNWYVNKNYIIWVILYDWYTVNTNVEFRNHQDTWEPISMDGYQVQKRCRWWHLNRSNTDPCLVLWILLGNLTIFPFFTLIWLENSHITTLTSTWMTHWARLKKWHQVQLLALGDIKAIW